MRHGTWTETGGGGGGWDVLLMIGAGLVVLAVAGPLLAGAAAAVGALVALLVKVVMGLAVLAVSGGVTYWLWRRKHPRPLPRWAGPELAQRRTAGQLPPQRPALDTRPVIQLPDHITVDQLAEAIRRADVRAGQ